MDVLNNNRKRRRPYAEVCVCVLALTPMHASHHADEYLHYFAMNNATIVSSVKWKSNRPAQFPK